MRLIVASLLEYVCEPAKFVYSTTAALSNGIRARSVLFNVRASVLFAAGANPVLATAAARIRMNGAWARGAGWMICE
jgi:hypothetical protein